MRLRGKVVALFGAAFFLLSVLALLGFPRLVSRVSETQLFSMARVLGAYVVHDLESVPFGGDEPAFEREIDARLEFITRLGADSGNFDVKAALVIAPDFKVEVAHPESEIGADYSSHADIRDAMGGAPMATVLESYGGTGGKAIDADIVSPLRLADGDAGVLEIKLDFTGSLALLEAQYATIRAFALAAFALAFLLVGAVIVAGIRHTILKPVLLISAAMERVGKGDLEAVAKIESRDEIGSMARRFDEMVRGLKERFQLERYVSRSTVDAARARAEDGGADRPVARKRKAVFFSDIRGFTSYSEARDPARVVAVLNRLLGMQEEIVRRAGGEVDKFVGDETMAVFERPAAAVAAALAIRARVARMCAEIDGLELGFGIHVGELVEGDIGSPRMMDHTVIGDTVNTAARLQSIAKARQVLISAAVAADRETAARFALEKLGSVSVKGKAESLQVFAVSGPRRGIGNDRRLSS